MKIRDIDNRQDLILITDFQDSQPIRNAFGVDYDSFFVEIKEGEYGEVFGFYGIVPDLDKKLYQVQCKKRIY